MHKAGSVYRIRTILNMLGTFQFGKKDYAVLISLEGDGNRWTDPVEVSNPYQITDEEMKLIAGECDYELWKGTVIIKERG